MVNDRIAELIKVNKQLQQEIEARKLAEEALRESEQKIRQLVERSPIAMVVYFKKDILMINKKLTELFGYTTEDIPDLDHWWPAAYPDQTGEELERREKEWTAWIGQSISKGTEIEPKEAWITCKDGSVRYVRMNAIFIGWGVLVTFIDLTEQKRAEEEERKKAEDALSWVEFLQRI